MIDAIQTPSMHEARITNQTAFALLKSIDGTPSLVKIFDLPNNKQVFFKIPLFEIIGFFFQQKNCLSFKLVIDIRNVRRFS